MIKRMLILTMLVCLCSTAIASDPPDDEEKKMPSEPQNIDIIKKAMINREIKKKTGGVFNKVYSAPFFETLPYTQTEAYLKADLGDEYQENDLLNNIEAFIKLYTINGRPFPAANIISSKSMADIIKNEKEYGGYHCFYNALRGGEWGFEYDVLDRLRQILSIAPDAEGRRTYGRLFDSLFNQYPTIQEAIKHLGRNDTHPEYQMRIASANIFLFGNIQNKGESTLEYLGYEHANDEIPDRPQCEILVWAFKELGFDRVEERVSRYANLFQSTEALWRRHVLQQIFVANASVNDLAFPSIGYGLPAYIMSGKAERSEWVRPPEPMMPLLIALRRDPVKFFAEHRNHLQPNLDIYSVQARLLWSPQAIAQQKMIVIPWSFWSGSHRKESDLRKELQEAMQKIDQLIIQDLADLLELKGSVSLKEAGIDSRLHRLKELVITHQAAKS